MGPKETAIFLNDYTYYAEVALLKHKCEIQDALMEFVNKAETHWNCKVSKIRCDNGREYSNNRMDKWARSKRIEFDWIIPHIPATKWESGKIESNVKRTERKRFVLCCLMPTCINAFKAKHFIPLLIY